MPLQNFVDKVGPVVSAAWLNMVDVLSTTVFNNAATPTQARTALGVLGASKPADLSRVNSGTTTIDPDLQVTVPPGTYRYEYVCFFTVATGGNVPGAQLQPAFSGTLGGSGGQGPVIYRDPTAGDKVSTDFGVTTSTPTGGIAVGVIAPDGGTVSGFGILKVTVTGVLSIYWGQATANAAATTLKAGSYIMVVQFG